MATKRQVVAQLSAEDLQLVAKAASGAKLEPKEAKQVRKAIKILRTIGPK